MNTRVKEVIIELAKASPNEEICGFIYETVNEVLVYPCLNDTRDEDGPSKAFELTPDAYAEVAKLGRPIGVYHSHAIDGSTVFSEADLDMARELELPFYLYANRDGSWHSYIPPGYEVPLSGREWHWGTSDCYETVRVYYRQTRGLYMTDYDRDESFENANESAITQYIAAEGFTAVAGNGPIQTGDVLLFRAPGSAYPHHLAVFLGHSKVLHHPRGGLSRVESLNDKWLKRLDRVLRYTGKPSIP